MNHIKHKICCTYNKTNVIKKMFIAIYSLGSSPWTTGNISLKTICVNNLLLLLLRCHYSPTQTFASLTLILPRSRTGTVWLYTSTSNKRAARPKLHTKSLTRDFKLMYSRFTLVRISINFNSSQLNMFREIILPIFRSTRLCAPEDG